jgi:hypothetical protein
MDLTDTRLITIQLIPVEFKFRRGQALRCDGFYS